MLAACAVVIQAGALNSQRIRGGYVPDIARVRRAIGAAHRVIPAGVPDYLRAPFDQGWSSFF